MQPDRFAAAADGARIRYRQEGSEPVVVFTHGHAIPTERPDEFHAEVDAFLADVP